MQINQLRFLVAVEKYGSISHAAQELYVSQSSISLALINLEEELGTSILLRGKRGVTFTPVGQTILGHAHTILDELEQIQHAVAKEGEISGDLHIAGTSHYAMNLITDTMLQCRNQFPNLHIYAHFSDYRRMIKEVAQKQLDMAFISYYDMKYSGVEVELQRFQLEFHKLLNDRCRICASKMHPLMEKGKIVVKDLSEFPLITLQSYHPNSMLPLLTDHGYQGEAISIADISNIRKFAAEVNGFFVIPETEIENSNRTYSTQMYPLNIADFDLYMLTGWVQQKNHELTPSEQKVIDLFRINAMKYGELSR